jgi:hypothetical protein
MLNDVMLVVMYIEKNHVRQVFGACLESFGACLELAWGFERRTYYISSLGVKSDLAYLGMSKPTNQNC